jgi:hypothetical protein
MLYGDQNSLGHMTMFGGIGEPRYSQQPSGFNMLGQSIGRFLRGNRRIRNLQPTTQPIVPMQAPVTPREIPMMRPDKFPEQPNLVQDFGNRDAMRMAANAKNPPLVPMNPGVLQYYTGPAAPRRTSRGRK